MNRKCGQSVTSDDRRTFTKALIADKDKVHHDQTLGNNNKGPMFDCKSRFHRSEEKRNCHVYVTSVMIITFMLFLLKQNTLSAVIFPLVLSLNGFVYIIFTRCAGTFVVYQITW